MRVAIFLLGCAVILTVLWDAFETIVLPRRVTRRLRLTPTFILATWTPWAALARRIRRRKRRETFLSIYGPLSLLMLISLWAVGLVLGFAIVHWSLATRVHESDGIVGFGTYLYMSGVTFFTLGFGDVTPLEGLGRFLDVLEAGIGFGFLAVVISYLPVLYQAFSKREVNISLLDARAGTPSSATELLLRHGRDGNMKALNDLLGEWERWSAELMESHLSYPVLCYFRSQHDNQSWVAALSTILDTCALVMVGVDSASPWQARLTFAMARHAVVDIAQIFNTKPRACTNDRLSAEDTLRLRSALRSEGIPLRDGAEANQKLAELRCMYEPYVNALADHLMMPLPPWVIEKTHKDNWQTSAWERNPEALAAAVEQISEEKNYVPEFMD